MADLSPAGTSPAVVLPVVTTTAEAAPSSPAPIPAPTTGPAGLAGRPAETVTAAAGAVGAALTQILGIDNSAIITVLFAALGLLPALVTFLIELGKKWEGSSIVSSDSDVAAELAYSQSRLLRAARIGEAYGSSAELERVKAIKTTFAGDKPQAGPAEGGSEKHDASSEKGAGEGNAPEKEPTGDREAPGATEAHS